MMACAIVIIFFPVHLVRQDLGHHRCLPELWLVDEGPGIDKTSHAGKVLEGLPKRQHIDNPSHGHETQRSVISA